MPIRPVILAPVRYYLPAFKAGGPIRTLSAMIDALSDEYAFKLIASCYDLGDRVPLPGIPMDAWTSVGPADVLYLSPGCCNARGILSAIRRTEHDLLYLNSMFDPVFTLAPLSARRLGWIPWRPLVTAPRGELSRDALAQKSLKKKLYLAAAGCLGLHRDVLWQASTDRESQEIEIALRRFPGLRTAAPVRVARDLAAVPPELPAAWPPKQPGRLRAVFLARISPIKNLPAVIDTVVRLPGEVSLDIYGIIEDRAGWERCLETIRRAGCQERIVYRGVVPHENILATLARYDVYILPTRSENFGHGIIEAMLAGCPVLISDRTPWRDLAAHQAGWELPLESPVRFLEILQDLAARDEAAFSPLRQGARAFALGVIQDLRAVEDNRALFATALEPKPQPIPQWSYHVHR